MAIYVFLFAFQDWGFRQNSAAASLIFLPHGWRVVSFFLFRFRALPGLLVGHIATCVLFFPNFTEMPWTYVATCIASVTPLPLVYLALYALGWDLLAPRKAYPVVPWTSFALLGVIATALNGVAVSSVHLVTASRDIDVNQLVQYAVGDLIGMIVFVGALLFYFRWDRRRRLAASTQSG